MPRRKQDIVQLNFSLPLTLREWVFSRVAHEEFGNVSEYLRSLIRQEQQKLSRYDLEERVLEALEQKLVPAKNTAENDNRMPAHDFEALDPLRSKRLGISSSSKVKQAVEPNSEAERRLNDALDLFELGVSFVQERIKRDQRGTTRANIKTEVASWLSTFEFDDNFFRPVSSKRFRLMQHEQN